MSRLSLTARLSLMFMLAVSSVLLVTGYVFNHLSQHHFDELDQYTLEEKLEAGERLIGRLAPGEPLAAIRPQLQVLLGERSDLAALILAPDGEVRFSVPPHLDIPALYRRFAGQPHWEWEADGTVWRGISRQVERPGPQPPLTMLLMLDVTTHSHFLHRLAGWLWAALLVCALASALLGWLLARSGLRPLREVTQLAASISARSLTERIPAESAPAELRQLLLAFNGMLDRLEEAFVRLSNFSADIAHELRTPVSNLMTHTEVVLTRARSSEDYQEALYSNLEELNRMARMIDDMLFLAKADNGLIIPERRPVALEALCASLLEYYQLLADERSIRLELCGAGVIEGDALMLRRALSNLLSNALRYTPDGECVRLDIRGSDASVTLEVSNPGRGIAPEHRERLFDRFYRADPARREGGHNAGLGLAITRSIVEAHRGRIDCTSIGDRTVFRLRFPRQVAAAAKA